MAKDITDFSMVMTMSNKNDGGEGGGVEDEDAGTVEAKKRKIKKVYSQSLDVVTNINSKTCF